MPLFDYECRECGARFERLVSASEADAQACVRCGAAQTRRLLPVIAGLSGRSPETAGHACGGGGCGACGC